MKVQNAKMKAMEKMFRRIRKGGLTATELRELGRLASYFLFISTAAQYTDEPLPGQIEIPSTPSNQGGDLGE